MRHELHGLDEQFLTPCRSVIRDLTMNIIYQPKQRFGPKSEVVFTRYWKYWWPLVGSTSCTGVIDGFILY